MHLGCNVAGSGHGMEMEGHTGVCLLVQYASCCTADFAVPFAWALPGSDGSSPGPVKVGDVHVHVSPTHRQCKESPPLLQKELRDRSKGEGREAELRSENPALDGPRVLTGCIHSPAAKVASPSSSVCEAKAAGGCLQFQEVTLSARNALSGTKHHINAGGSLNPFWVNCSMT